VRLARCSRSIWIPGIMIKRLAERELSTTFGNYIEFLYYDGLKESIALVMGDVEGGEAFPSDVLQLSR